MTRDPVNKNVEVYFPSWAVLRSEGCLLTSIKIYKFEVSVLFVLMLQYFKSLFCI